MKEMALVVGSRSAILAFLTLCMLATACPTPSSGSEHVEYQTDSASDTRDEIHELSDFERILGLFTEEERELLFSDGTITEGFVTYFIDEGFTDDDIRMFIEFLIGMLTSHATREAGVVTGTQLEWRVLRAWDATQPDAYDWMFVDNFDSDPADEIVISSDFNFELIQIRDGASTPVGLSAATTSYFVSWDFDGDGIAELLDQVKTTASYDANEIVDVMEAISLAGEHKGYVRGNPMGPNIVRGDFNGDGITDLYMSAESLYSADETVKAQAFGTFGEVLFTAQPEWNSPYIITGDTDGDQCDEIILVSADTVITLDIDGDTQELVSWYLNYPDDSPSWCCDLSGDGTDEMLSGNGLVCDLVNDETWELEWPPGWSDMYFDGIFGPSVFAVELPELPNARIAAIPAEDSIYAETFVLWTADGVLLYAEYFGELVEILAIAKVDNRQYIVLLTESRLLVWP